MSEVRLLSLDDFVVNLGAIARVAFDEAMTEATIHLVNGETLQLAEPEVKALEELIAGQDYLSFEVESGILAINVDHIGCLMWSDDEASLLLDTGERLSIDESALESIQEWAAARADLVKLVEESRTHAFSLAHVGHFDRERATIVLRDGTMLRCSGDLVDVVRDYFDK